MFKRNLLSILDKKLADFPAIVVVGVRQCGKSSLVRSLRPDWDYFDLERPADRDLILQDPTLFFRNHPHSIILDEAQLYPELLGTLRGVIDANRDVCNRFIITGSSSPELLRFSSDSLAGRVALTELSPLKMNEISSVGLPRFYTVFESPITEKSRELIKALKPVQTNEVLYRTWLRGGFPEPQSRNDPDFFNVWQENYFRTFVERDLKQLFSGIDSENYRVFLALLKDYHANTINISDISRSLGLSEATIRKYLEIADLSFFWRKLPSYERTAVRSVVKNPRGFYRDSGHFYFASNIFSTQALEVSRYRGASFEAFVIEEIMRGIACVKAYNTNASFFRTRGGAEVDLVLSGSFGCLPVEIKCRSSLTIKDLKSLAEFVERESLLLGIVVTLGERVDQLSDSIFAVPANCL
jgi:uncharacterized protein